MLLLTTLGLSSTHASESKQVNSLEALLGQINQTLNTTKANTAYQPYMITVLYAEHLKKVGVSNLEEAVLLAAGADVHSNTSNERSFVFRGSNPFAHGQIRLEIDGVDSNDLLSENFNEFMRMPIELIRRIEIVRGPGAEITTETSFSGKICVITYAENNPLVPLGENINVFAKGGSGDFYGAGMRYTNKVGDKLFVHLDTYVQTDDQEVQTGYDAANTGKFNIPALGIDNTGVTRKGTAHIGRDDIGIGAKIDYNGAYLQTRFQQTKTDLGFGNLELLPLSNEYEITKRMLTIESGYKGNFKDTSYLVAGGYKRGYENSYDQSAPPGIVYPGVNTFPNPVTYADGFYADATTDLEAWYGKALFQNMSFDDHTLTLGGSLKLERAANVSFYSTDRDTGTGWTDQMPYSQPIDPDLSRKTFNVVAGDTYRISDSIKANIALNIERNNQYHQFIYDPKASLIYNANNTDIFKLIYSKSHRDPSLRELYRNIPLLTVGDEDLKPVRVDSYEFAYAHRINDKRYIQASIYYLDIKDRITPDPLTFSMSNSGDASYYGVEVEGEYVPWSRAHLYANYSYTKGKDSENSPAQPHSIAKHIANAYLSQNFLDTWSAGLKAKYIGPKMRSSYDYRNDRVSETFLFDATLSYKPSNALNINVSAKNIFNEDWRIPTQAYSYDDDLPQIGRHYLVSLEYEF